MINQMLLSLLRWHRIQNTEPTENKKWVENEDLYKHVLKKKMNPHENT